jgi:hypothetical protein
MIGGHPSSVRHTKSFKVPWNAVAPAAMICKLIASFHFVVAKIEARVRHHFLS